MTVLVGSYVWKVGLILEIREMKQEGPGSCNVIIRLIMGKPSLRKVKDGRSMLFA